MLLACAASTVPKNRFDPQDQKPLTRNWFKTARRALQDACDHSRWLVRRRTSREAMTSGQKSHSSHTHSPFAPGPRLSERRAEFHQASAARCTRSLATRAHVSTRDVFDWLLLLVNPSRAPAASANPSCIEDPCEPCATRRRGVSRRAHPTSGW